MPYFAYCTLLDVNEMRRFVPTALPGATGRVNGYRVVFASHGPDLETGGCHLEREPDATLHGLLYDLNDDEFSQLDAISGVDRGLYQRIAVTVDTSSRPVAAETYVIPDPGGPFRPTVAYTRPILAGARALCLPEGYTAELEQTITSAQRTNEH